MDDAIHQLSVLFLKFVLAASSELIVVLDRFGLLRRWTPDIATVVIHLQFECLETAASLRCVHLMIEHRKYSFCALPHYKIIRSLQKGKPSISRFIRVSPKVITRDAERSLRL